MSPAKGTFRSRLLPIGTIILGVVLLVQSFGWVSSRYNWVFPVIVLVVAAVLLVRAWTAKGNAGRGLSAAVLLLIVGVLLLLVTLDVVTGAWVLPAVIILLGLAMLRGD